MANKLFSFLFDRFRSQDEPMVEESGKLQPIVNDIPFEEPVEQVVLEPPINLEVPQAPIVRQSTLEEPMNKAELLDKLRAKYTAIGLPVKVMKGELGLQWYKISAHDRTIDTVNRYDLSFFVENEGEENEVAYWHPSEPKPTSVISPPPEPSFQDKVLEYITGKINAGVIQAGFIEDIDSGRRIVIIKAVKNISGVLKIVRYLINKDALDQFQINPIE